MKFAIIAAGEGSRLATEGRHSAETSDSALRSAYD